MLRFVAPLLLVACADSSRGVEVERVVPDRGDPDLAQPIEIHGTFHVLTSNLDQGDTVAGAVTATVDSIPLSDAVWVSQDRISATMPGLAEGAYDITVSIDGRSSTRASAYTVGSGTLDAGLDAGASADAAQPQPVAFVQGGGGFINGTFSSFASPFAAPQLAGNLNLVVVSWLDTSQPGVTVTDTDGNAYLPIGTSVSAGFGTQAVFHAPNITGGAGTNTVTATFTATVTRPELRLLEYSGLATSNAVDTTVVATGTGTAVDSGPATTTQAHTLIVGANYVETAVQSPGPGFTTRVNVSNDTVEDMEVTSAGTYRATATQSVSARWVMCLIAFRAAQ